MATFGSKSCKMKNPIIRLAKKAIANTGVILWGFWGFSQESTPVVFYKNISIGTKNSVALYSKHHWIKNTIPPIGTLSYPLKETQYVWSTGAGLQINLKTNPSTNASTNSKAHLTINTLNIYNPNGVVFHGRLTIGAVLNLEKGGLEIKAPEPLHYHTLAPQERQTYGVFFTSQAAVIGYQKNKYIKGPVYALEKTNFFFPIGNATAWQPIGFKASAYVASLGIAHINAENNKIGTKVYSTPNALKRSGIKKIDPTHYWALYTQSTNLIRLSWAAILPFYKTSGAINKGLAGWSTVHKNWRIIPASFNPETQEYQSEPFASNAYERVALCDCSPVEKGFTPYGNFILTLNGDGFNELPHFKQYTPARNGILQLYNRNGLLLFTVPWNQKDKVLKHFKKSILTTGTYFYTLQLTQPKQRAQGYFYIIKNE